MTIIHEEDGKLIGADDVIGSIVIDLSDLNLESTLADDVEAEEGSDVVPDSGVPCKVIGIEVEKVGPSEGNLFGYWPRVLIEGNEDMVSNDFFASLYDLCEEYDLPIDVVIDRISLELLRRNIVV